MEITKTLQRKAGNYFLSKRLKQFNRVRQMHTLNTAKTAGIIITPTDQDSFDQIKKFISHLTSKGVKVYILGFVDDKKIPDSFLFWKGINLFSRKELNWAGVPESATVNDFIDQPFDMLIDLSTSDHFPIHYISTLSKSYFKIGRLDDSIHQCYDLMFELNDETSLNDYIDNLTHYLDMLSEPKS